jgi:hypothetical protein
MKTVRLMGNYLPQADRILLKIMIAPDETWQLILTRRLTRALMHHMKTHVFEAPKKEVSKKKTSKKAAPQPEKKVGQSDQPDLKNKPQFVTKIMMNTRDEKPVIYFVMHEGVKLSIGLNDSLTKALSQVLDKLQAKAEWGLIQNTASKKVIPSPQGIKDKRKLH